MRHECFPYLNTEGYSSVVYNPCDVLPDLAKLYLETIAFMRSLHKRRSNDLGRHSFDLQYSPLLWRQILENSQLSSIDFGYRVHHSVSGEGHVGRLFLQLEDVISGSNRGRTKLL